MMVLIYNIDKGGIKSYSNNLIDAIKKTGAQVKLSDKIDYNYDIYHIEFEHSLFHPFGLGLIPLLIKLKFKRKKIIITSHTILSKKQIYSQNEFFTFIKKILLPLDEKLMNLFYDKITVHTIFSKRILINDYNIPNEKIEVIPHGIGGHL